MADSFSNCKHNNFLPYFMGGLFAKKNKFNDAIVLNNHNRVCETTIANVFIIKKGNISTPSLSEGCIAGVMRKSILQTLDVKEINVNETSITEEILLDADEVFFTNSMYNIRWVSNIENKMYMGKEAREIYELLSKTNAAVFC
jgi:branched-chain amino acid aminotransferase